MKHRPTTLLLVLIASLTASVSGGQAEPHYTEKNPKYARPKSPPHPAESIGQLENSVVDAFKAKFFPKKGGDVRVYIRVDDRDLVDNPDTLPLRNVIKPNDVVSGLTVVLRKAGFKVVREMPEDEGYLVADVRMGARSTKVHDIETVTTEWIPDLETQLSTSWDQRVVGQAMSLEFLGSNARSLRAFERMGTSNLIRAMGILLLRDLATDNWAEVSWDARKDINQASGAISTPGKTVPLPASLPGRPSVKPPQSAQNPPPPQPVPGQASATVQPEPVPITPPDVGGPALLAQEDRERALRQILSALDAGKG